MGVVIVILSIALVFVSAIGIFFILKSSKYVAKFNKAESDYYSKSAQLNLLEIEKTAWQKEKKKLENQLEEKKKLEHKLEEVERYTSYIRVERPEVIKLKSVKRLSTAQIEFMENEEEVEKLVKSELQRDLAEQMMNYVEICTSKDIVNYENIYRAEVHIVEYKRW